MSLVCQVIHCLIKGIEPGLLMHRFPLIPIEGLDKMSPEEQAEHAAYRIPDTRELYIPGTAIQRAIVAAASFSKGKGRASLQKVVAACVSVSPEYCGLGRTEYVIDGRAVVIRATKGKVVRYRPRLIEWSTHFSLTFDGLMLKEDQMRRVLDDTGSRVGLLDFRPACYGPFGRFMVIGWKLQKNDG